MNSNDFDSGDVKVIDNLHLKSYSCLVARELESLLFQQKNFSLVVNGEWICPDFFIARLRFGMLEERLDLS